MAICLSTAVVVGLACLLCTYIIRYLTRLQTRPTPFPKTEEPHKESGSPTYTNGKKVYRDVCNDLMNLETVSFEWNIQSFSRRKGVLRSSMFPTAAPREVGKWWLELDTHRLSGDTLMPYKQSVYISLHGEKPIPKLLKISIFSTNKKLPREWDYVRHERNNSNQVNPVYDTSLADRSYILNPANGLLPNDVLTILCELEIETPPAGNTCQDLIPIKYH